MGWSKLEWDKLDDQWWKDSTSEEIVKEIMKYPSRLEDGRPVPPARFRFAVKGEIWTCVDDVSKVRGVLSLMPETLFWIPTRAWRDLTMRAAIDELVLAQSNARVMASLDPTNGEHDFTLLRDRGWPLLFSGDNDPDEQLMLVEGGAVEKLTKNMRRCEKTWEDRHGHCAICTEGCFSSNQVDVHLRQHR